MPEALEGDEQHAAFRRGQRGGTCGVAERVLQRDRSQLHPVQELPDRLGRVLEEDVSPTAVQRQRAVRRVGLDEHVLAQRPELLRSLAGFTQVKRVHGCGRSPPRRGRGGYWRTVLA